MAARNNLRKAPDRLYLPPQVGLGVHKRRSSVAVQMAAKAE